MHFDLTSRNKLPAPQIILSILSSANLISKSNPSTLSITSYSENLLSYTSNIYIIGAALFLKNNGFALAIDQPLEILFVDDIVLSNIVQKWPKLLEYNNLDIELLSMFVEKVGFGVANISINIESHGALREPGQMEFFQRKNKSFWKRIFR